MSMPTIRIENFFLLSTIVLSPTIPPHRKPLAKKPKSLSKNVASSLSILIFLELPKY